MGVLSRRKAKQGDKAQGAPRSLLAAAMPIEGRAGKQAWDARSGDDSWQKQAWYYYDAVGELRFAFNWLASAISRASLYAAEVDPETGLMTGPTDDPRAQAAAAQILGGIDDRPGLQSLLALQWQVAGETFILIQPQSGGEPDRWMTLSVKSVRQQGGNWSFKDPLTGIWTRLRDGVDRLIRVWSPHPDDPTHADSAMRAAIPICSEIEKSSQNIVARLDSRLAGNGIMFVPQSLSFPSSDGEQSGAESLTMHLLQAAEAAIAEPGTAAAQVPIFVEVPDDVMASMTDAHIDLATAMDGTITDLRESAMTRLGRTLDMPRELAMGELASANHWSGWLIEESTYKIHVEPFLLKLGMALVKTWYRPALVAMGMTREQADRFVLGWDITEVVARPDDKEDVKYLLENNLVSADWARGRFGVPDDAIPTDEEARRNLARVMVIGAPTLLENPSVASLLGFDPTPADGTSPAVPTVEPPAPVRALPQTRSNEPDEGLVAAAELVVFDALSRAGGRLLTRQYRGQFAATPKWELHTVIPVLHDAGEISRLLEGSFQFTQNVAHAFALSPAGLDGAIRDYVDGRLRLSMAHNRDVLRGHLRTVGPE